MGKTDETDILPLNNSVSLTLDTDILCSSTFLSLSTEISKSIVFVNDKEADVSDRMIRMFKTALMWSNLSTDIRDRVKFRLDSCNNFPTAAGLASSASGMAAFSFALGQLLDLKSKEVALIARMGSGSATRSVLGGIVEWRCGDAMTSRGVQLYDETYWPQLRVLICVLDQKKKQTGSTNGMRDSVITSQLLPLRVEHCVPANIASLKTALADRNMAELAIIAQRESNQLHAVCLDSTPPLVYLSEASHAVMRWVKAVNAVLADKGAAGAKVGYTFDAGPNPFLLCEESSVPVVRALLYHCFTMEEPDNDDVNFLSNLDPKMLEKVPRFHHKIQRVIESKVGSGPKVAAQQR